MRQITQDSINAFLCGSRFSRQNMSVDIDERNGNVQLCLHGNLIAERRADGTLWISDAGWKTNTTKERLNGLPCVNIYQKDFTWYLNGKEWNGNWIEIENAREAVD